MASTSEVLDEIETLAQLRYRDPANVIRRVDELIAGHEDPRVQASGRLASGLALQEVGRIREAVASLRQCVDTSVEHSLVDQEALGRAQLAISLLNIGEAATAAQEMARARQIAPFTARGVVECLWASFLSRTGRLDACLAACQRSLRWLAEVGDSVAVVRARNTRGIALAYQGEFDAALEDFGFGEQVAVERALPAMAAMSAHNIGFTHGRRGDLPRSLAAFERAERSYAALESPHRFKAVLEADRCQVLLLAGLATDARRSAEIAVEALEQVDEVELSECRLLLARTLLAEGSYKRAAAESEGAGQSFRRLRRPSWAAQARYVAIQAEVLALQDRSLPSPSLLRRGRRIANELEAEGWPVEALHVRTYVGRMALALGRPEVARAELGQAAAARSRGTADLRAQAWHAVALLRVADGDVAGAKRALARGIAVVDQYRVTLGATELRANASGHGTDLAKLGVRLALEGGRPADVLRWADRCRAGALNCVSVCPPPDEHLAAMLAELRQVRAGLREASLGGAAGSEARVAQAAALEDSVRNHTRQARLDPVGTAGRVDMRALRRALGDGALVEYLTHDGTLYAVTVTARRARLHELGETTAVEREKDYLLFALRRLLLGRSAGAASAALAAAATRLDDVLVAPLRLPATTPVVVVPTGALHGLPWSCLPGLAGRNATIAPSAALWLGSPAPVVHDGRGEKGRVALVAGPHLPGAEAEVAQLASLHPRAEVLVGASATSANVLAAMERADVVHVAAHGDFRADSPMFSSLLLADGPLTVYEVERIRTVPRLVVLSACDAAVADVRAGDELIGTAAALLGLGVRSVVAPVFAVPDAATTLYMVAFHRKLLAGAPPASALASVAPDQDAVASAAFVCIGRSDPR